MTALLLGVLLGTAVDRLVRPPFLRRLGWQPARPALALAAVDVLLGSLLTGFSAHRPFTAGVWTAVALCDLWDWWNDDDQTDRRDRARERAHRLLRRFAPSPIPTPAL